MKGLLIALFVPAAMAQPPVVSRQFRLEELKTPPGYQVSVYARVAGGPRHMTFGPNGVLYVAARGAGSVVAIPEPNRVVTVVARLNGPHSLAFRDGDLYIGQNDGVVRVRDAVTEDLIIRGAVERVVSLPVPGANQHSTRTIGFGPDGKLYLTAGSTCNFCVESTIWRAAMQRFDADGSNQQVYARGLRNSVSFGWHPLTGELWATDNGGDDLGDNEPPEELDVIDENADYGWPDCIGQKRGVRWGPQARPERCGETKAPEFEMQAHMAPLGISFYSGELFPGGFINDALVTLHGSWNRNEPAGYKVIRVRASSGRATAAEDFLWGFLDLNSRSRSGRPVQAISGPDGAVYVSDDDTGNIYRVDYVGPRMNPGGIVQVFDKYYAIYGRHLANDPARFRLTVNGIPAETLYLSDGQVNFVMPEGTAGDALIVLTNEIATDEAIVRVE